MVCQTEICGTPDRDHLVDSGVKGSRMMESTMVALMPEVSVRGKGWSPLHCSYPPSHRQGNIYMVALMLDPSTTQVMDSLVNKARP